MMEEVKTLRIKKINPFLLSNGVVLKSNLIIFLLVIFEAVLTFILFIDYQFFTHTNLTIFETLNKSGGDIFILNRYFVLHYIDNLIIDTINSFISDIKNFIFTMPHFYDFIEYDKFSLNILGYIEIYFRIFLTLILFCLTFIQIREQQKFSTVGLHSIYRPIFLIIFSKYYKDFYFYKRVIGIKRDMINNDKKMQLIELFFNKSEIYLNNDIKNIELKTETLSIFFDFYNFFRLSLELKSQKK